MYNLISKKNLVSADAEASHYCHVMSLPSKITVGQFSGLKYLSDKLVFGHKASS